ncbi:hypothetical protein ACFL54_03730 [Planctomycetota bacterium]
MKIILTKNPYSLLILSPFNLLTKTVVSILILIGLFITTTFITTAAGQGKQTSFGKYRLKFNISNRQQLRAPVKSTPIILKSDKSKLPARTALRIDLYRIYPVLYSGPKKVWRRHDLVSTKRQSIRDADFKTEYHEPKYGGELAPAYYHLQVFLDRRQRRDLGKDLQQAVDKLGDDTMLFMGTHAIAMETTAREIKQLSELVASADTIARDCHAWYQGLHERGANKETFDEFMAGWRTHFDKMNQVALTAFNVEKNCVMTEAYRLVKLMGKNWMFNLSEFVKGTGMANMMAPQTGVYVLSSPNALDFRYHLSRAKTDLIKSIIMNLDYHIHDLLLEVAKKYPEYLKTPSEEARAQLDADWQGMITNAEAIWQQAQAVYGEEFIKAMRKDLRECTDVSTKGKWSGDQAEIFLLELEQPAAEETKEEEKTGEEKEAEEGKENNSLLNKVSQYLQAAAAVHANYKALAENPRTPSARKSINDNLAKAKELHPEMTSRIRVIAELEDPDEEKE